MERRIPVLSVFSVRSKGRFFCVTVRFSRRVLRPPGSFPFRHHRGKERMYITQRVAFQATNWPNTSPATQYTLFQVVPTPSVPLQNIVGDTAVILGYEDTQDLVFQIRPSSGPLDTLTVGPVILTFVVGYVPCLGWLRQKIRRALADRADISSAVALSWPDDEITGYLHEAIGELSIRFPLEQSIQIPLQGPMIDAHGHPVGVTTYPLPSDFYMIKTIEYVTSNGLLHYFLREKPWRGGESTATSFYGYPKLGILFSPTMLTGRFYPGHFQVSQNQIQLDWSPSGDGDYLTVTYLGRRAFPSGDADLLQGTPEDMELLSLYTQMKCWFRIEVQDARLSRWRGNPEGSSRDGLTTVKHWTQIKQLYNERVNDRLELRPRALRLVRR